MRITQKILSAACLMAAPAIAFAYVDPGTGAYALQTFMALLAAATFHLSHPVRFIKMLWARMFKKTRDDKA